MATELILDVREQVLLREAVRGLLQSDLGLPVGFQVTKRTKLTDTQIKVAIER